MEVKGGDFVRVTVRLTSLSLSLLPFSSLSASLCLAWYITSPILTHATALYHYHKFVAERSLGEYENNVRIRLLCLWSDPRPRPPFFEARTSQSDDDVMLHMVADVIEGGEEGCVCS